jgi:hypothetical protein
MARGAVRRCSVRWLAFYIPFIFILAVPLAGSVLVTDFSIGVGGHFNDAIGRKCGSIDGDRKRVKTIGCMVRNFESNTLCATVDM